METVQALTNVRDAALARQDFWTVKLLTKVIARVQARVARLAAKGKK